MCDRGVILVLVVLNIARVNPYRSDQSEPPGHMAWFAPHRTGEGGHLGGDLRSTSYPVDDVHQAWMTWDIGDG